MSRVAGVAGAQISVVPNAMITKIDRVEGTMSKLTIMPRDAGTSGGHTHPHVDPAHDESYSGDEDTEQHHPTPQAPWMSRCIRVR